MTPEQTAYAITCALMFGGGVVVLTIGVALGNALDDDYDWPGLVVGFGLLAMLVGPFMLVGFPA